MTHSLWMNTMNRWIPIALTAALLAPPLAVLAQGFVREAPKDVRPGRLVVKAPPEITLDGKPDRLSPGARIRNTNNLLLLTGSVVGQELPVVYRRDAAGLVHEAWVLTPDEYARLGGTDGSPDGARRFAELLALIFGARK
jgi:hypothetical protein